MEPVSQLIVESFSQLVELWHQNAPRQHGSPEHTHTLTPSRSVLEALRCSGRFIFPGLISWPHASSLLTPLPPPHHPPSPTQRWPFLRFFSPSITPPVFVFFFWRGWGGLLLLLCLLLCLAKEKNVYTNKERVFQQISARENSTN